MPVHLHYILCKRQITRINSAPNVTQVRFLVAGIKLLLSKVGTFLLKVEVYHSGKFAPRENNLLYGTFG